MLCALTGPREEGLSDDEGSPTSVTSAGFGARLDRPGHMLLGKGASRRRAAGSAYANGTLKGGAYPVPVSPSGRYVNESFRDRIKRQLDDPRSPGALYDPKLLVVREHLLINRFKRARRCIGLPGKLYNKFDVVEPIVDALKMLHHVRGWDTDQLMVVEDASNAPLRRATSSDEQLHTLGYGPAPVVEPVVLCTGCRSTDRNDFMLTSDKSHLVCKCGVVSSANRIALNREKNCAAEDDKTTHADKPYQPRTDRFDHPAQSCDEMRRQRERDAQGTRVSKKAKQKHGLGWTHEHNAREAARAERQRNSMEPKDQTKGQHILIEMEKLFTPLEPIDNQVKRFCRTEADRAWREAVRHSKICKAKGKCQLRVKEKGPAVIADAVLTCALNTLIDGHVAPLDGVSRASLLVIADKLGALQNAKGTSCALRAVRTVVGTLLSHNGADPIEPCPIVTCQPVKCSPASPPAASPQAASPQLPQAASPCAASHFLAANPDASDVPDNAPFQRNDSSVSDFGDSNNELLQQRDSVHRVFKAIGTSMPNSVREATLRAIQNPQFRSALAVAQEQNADVGRLSPNGLSFVLLSAVARQAERVTGIPHTSKIPHRLLVDFASSAAQLEAAASALYPLLPQGLNALPASEEDGLFG